MLQTLLGLHNQIRHLIGQRLQPNGTERLINVALKPAALPGLTHAIGRQNTPQGMQKHGTDPQLFSKATGVLA